MRGCAHGVESPVEYAVSGFEIGEEPARGRCCGVGALRQSFRLGAREFHTKVVETRRVLADEQLQGKIAGVERARERSYPGLVHLEPEGFADGQLLAVRPDGPVLLDARDHEQAWEFRRRFWFLFLPTCGQPVAELFEN